MPVPIRSNTRKQKKRVDDEEVKYDVTVARSCCAHLRLGGKEKMVKLDTRDRRRRKKGTSISPLFSVLLFVECVTVVVYLVSSPPFLTLSERFQKLEGTAAAARAAMTSTSSSDIFLLGGEKKMVVYRPDKSG